MTPERLAEIMGLLLNPGSGTPEAHDAIRDLVAHIDTLAGEWRPMIEYEPAECSRAHCHDDTCPYIHRDVWRLGSDVFRTEEEARAALTALASRDERK